MKVKVCPVCKSAMKRNGRTTAGNQRWRCRSCGASTVHSNDTSARDLKAFLEWLTSKDAQRDMPAGGRTFRRRVGRFWSVWPVPSVVEESHRVVYVDGIYIARDLVVLIACTDEHVLSWYMARSESKRAWAALMSRIEAPQVVVTDGGTGFAGAVREEWPTTRVQRCVFHAFNQVKRCTTTRPKLQAGVEIYGLAKDLLHLDDLHQAERWVERYLEWCSFWADFLEQRSYGDSGWEYTHRKLRQARQSLSSLVNKGTLFTYLDPELAAAGPLPRTNNRIEGGVNSQLRAMLREHRGMSMLRRVKAVFWWCYMHTENPLRAADILEAMPTDESLDELYAMFAENPREVDEPAWGEAPVWDELHHRTPCPYSII